MKKQIPGAVGYSCVPSTTILVASSSGIVSTFRSSSAVFSLALRFIDFFLGLYSCAFSYSLTILASTRIFDLEGMTLGGCNLRFFVLHIVLVEELSK